MREAAPRLLSVEAWIEAIFGAGAPSVKTVRRWIREGYIFPAPNKLGRGYYMRSDARYVDPANPPADLKPTDHPYPLLVKAGFVPASSGRPRRARGQPR